MNTLKFGNGEWYGKKDTILAYNDENSNFKPLPFSFDRASSATRVNKDGLIETVGSGEPRIDFSNDVKGALLLEPSRTNYLLQSNQFDTTWTNTNTTVTSGQVGVGGSSDAWKVDISSAFAQVEQTVSNNGVQTFSVYAKAGTLNWIRLRVDHTSFSGTYFDLQNGQVGSTVGTDSTSIENLGNGWYRCTIVVDDNVTRARIYPASANNDLSATSGNIYIQNSQLEQGSYATSLIPTQGSIGTRVAESCNNAGNEQVINSTEGVLYVETKGFIDVPPTSKYIQLSKSGEASFNNSLLLQHRNNGYLRIYANGTATANIHFNENIDFSENHKIAVLYKLNGYKLFIDGVEKNLFGTPLQTVFSGLDDFSFDNRGSNGWNGKIKEVKLYNEILTDQELINLTTI